MGHPFTKPYGSNEYVTLSGRSLELECPERAGPNVDEVNPAARSRSDAGDGTTQKR
jgi:hypothetical protein